MLITQRECLNLRQLRHAPWTRARQLCGPFRAFTSSKYKQSVNGGFRLLNGRLSRCVTCLKRTWTPPGCQVSFGEQNRLQSYIRPVDGVVSPGLYGIRRRGPI
jgi:hypothetical protein